MDGSKGGTLLYCGIMEPRKGREGTVCRRTLEAFDEDAPVIGQVLRCRRLDLWESSLAAAVAVVVRLVDSILADGEGKRERGKGRPSEITFHDEN